MPALARRIGPFDATMVVMGGIVGSGIFVTPAIVARAAGPWMLWAWLVGGVAALLGAFVYADLSARRPQAGGQYVYLRDAFHPAVAFLYGWALLLVVQTGGMAACAITFARYSGLPGAEAVVAAAALAALTLVNCLGVAAGSRVQSALMVIKIAAIAALIAGGVLGTPYATRANAAVGMGDRVPGSLGTALIPVLFSYGGWQTACFVAGELKHPARDLPRALIAGVVGVILLYSGVAVGCARVLGIAGLGASSAPAMEVARLTLGPRGASLISAGIAVSSLGFLSQSILTAPRVYFAMAEDGLFFPAVGRVHPRTRAPVTAIVLQGALAALIALLGTFEAILEYVVSIDFIFFALTAACLFVFARRGERLRMPGHPLTTLAFIGICLYVVRATFLHDPGHSLIGLGLTLLGLPVYLLWRRSKTT